MASIFAAYFCSPPAGGDSTPPPASPIEANAPAGWYDTTSTSTSGGRLNAWRDKQGAGPTLLSSLSGTTRRRVNSDGSVLLGPNADTRNADPGDGPLQVSDGSLVDLASSDVTLFFVLQTFYFKDNPRWTLTNTQGQGLVNLLQFRSQLYNGFTFNFSIGVTNGTFGLLDVRRGSTSTVPMGRGGRNWNQYLQTKTVVSIRLRKSCIGLDDLRIAFNGNRQQNVFATSTIAFPGASTRPDLPPPIVANAPGFILGNADGFMMSMYEMVFFKRELEETAIVAIENQLKQKHGIA